MNVYLITDRLSTLLQSEHSEESSLWHKKSSPYTDDWDAGELPFSVRDLVGEVATDSEKASGLRDCHGCTRSLSPSVPRFITVEGE
ncbi:MAG: hypothetical protein ACFCU2_09715 [Acidimicrobiia bacterium]